MQSLNKIKKTYPQNKQNGKRKLKKKSKGSSKKKTISNATTERDGQISKVWTEYDEMERLCLPNYKFVPTVHSETKQNYPEHYDVGKYVALQSAVERREYRNLNDLRKNIQPMPDESETIDHSEHRLCHKQLRGQRCDNPLCSFKHEFRLPRKLRLCSEWRKGTCTDGNGCLYLHSEFPCRYHYLGMKSQKHDVQTCRYHHGGPLPKEYEDMFLETIDSTKLPMFRQMYSKRLCELRGQVGDVERKEDSISTHESTEQQTQEIDSSSMQQKHEIESRSLQQKQEVDSSSLTAKDCAVAESVEDVTDKKVNASDLCQQNEPDRSNVRNQNNQESSDDEHTLHIVDD